MSDRIDRRTFMGHSLALGGLAATASVIPILGRTQPEAAAANIVLVEGEVKAAVNMAIEALGGMKRFVKPGQSVFIKANISFSSPPESGANTHPVVVSEVARMCVEAGAKSVLVGDYPLKSAEACLEKSGIRDALKNVPNTTVSMFTDKKFYETVELPQAKSVKKVELLKPLHAADVVINLPVAKSHGSSQITMALKNMMGVVYDRKSFHTRYKLDEAIADLATLIKTDLVVLDASRAIVSGGPGGPGTVEKLNTIIAGINPVEVDAIGVTLSSWDGKKISGAEVRQLAAAKNLGLGNIDPEVIKPRRLKA